MTNVKKILVSQNAPSNMAPYSALCEKFGVEFDFKPFFLIKPLSFKDFRAQRINISEYTAVVFSSRHTIDAYFALCEEARFKVPETMKYFCTTELIATYLQKHIVYRKRKIFFGNGRPESLLDIIGTKHKGEKFLIATSDATNGCGLADSFSAAGIDHSVAVMVQDVPQDLHSLDLGKYDMAILYNQFDLKSLLINFPDFKQGSLKFLAYGKGIAKALEDASFNVEIHAPTTEAPSVARALEIYLEA